MQLRVIEDIRNPIHALLDYIREENGESCELQWKKVLLLKLLTGIFDFTQTTGPTVSMITICLFNRI